MIVVNPIFAGSLSLSKLQAATAAPADVLLDKTFYSGSKILQTGSLVPVKFATGTFRVPYNSSSTTINLGFRPKVVIGVGVGDASGYKFAYSEDLGVRVGAYMSSNEWKIFSSGIHFAASGFVASAGNSYPIRDIFTYSYCAYG